MSGCRRSLTQYFDEQQQRRRMNMASASVATATGYGWSSSGYVTCSSLSDEDAGMVNGEEEERDLLYSRKSEKRGEKEEDRLHPGICPHCNFIYEKPVTLRCGHSLCDHCCTELLSRMDTTSVPRSRPRMGISSYSRTSLNKTMTTSRISLNGVFSLWKSPRCPVCGESPKKTPPVPNLSLEDFLTTIRLPPTLRQLYDRENKLPSDCSTNGISPGLSLTPFSLSHSLSTPFESSRVSIRDCLISIVGSKGVGKTCLLQTQLCNDMLIDELLGRGSGRGSVESAFPHSPLSDVSSLRNEKKHKRGGTTYMLKLMETGDLDEKISLSMGVVVTYSVTERESFHYAHRLLSLFSDCRGSEMPMILVGTKSDLERRRQVHSYEGQKMAKKFNCPFIEVSSRRNELVNESFVELVRVMDSRNLLK